MCEEADNSSKKKKGFFKKPNEGLWCATSMVLIYAVWCALVLILAASGQLWNNQSLGCGLNTEFESRLENEAQLIYVWSGCNLVFCTLLVLAIWKRKGCWTLMCWASFFVFVAMNGTLIHLVRKNSQEIQTFQKKYLPLLPFTDTIKNPWSNRGILTEMNCWQTQFRCCGLQGFQDWNTSFPDSCFYDEEQDNNWVGTTLLPRRNIYEKACFPAITSLVEKRSSAVWIIIIVWLTVIAAPFVIFALGAVVMCFVVSCLICEVSYKLSVLKYRICGGEKMVPVVFIRKNNNNQTEKEDVEAKETAWEDGVILEGLDDNPLRMIPVSLLRRLQEELDPPPVQHQEQNFPEIQRPLPKAVNLKRHHFRRQPTANSPPNGTSADRMFTNKGPLTAPLEITGCLLSPPESDKGHKVSTVRKTTPLQDWHSDLLIPLPNSQNLVCRNGLNSLNQNIKEMHHHRSDDLDSVSDTRLIRTSMEEEHVESEVFVEDAHT